MATARRLSGDSDGGINECSICVDVFKNPKSLPCLHTFCLDCIKTYAKNKRVGERVACPLCRKLFTIPPGGLDELPHNFWIDKLEKQRTSSTNSQETVPPVASQDGPVGLGNGSSQLPRQRPNKFIPKLQSFTTTTQTELAQVEVDKQKLLTQVAESKEKISKRCADLKRMLDEQEGQLVQQVTVSKDTHLKELTTRKQELEMHLSSLEGFKRYSDETIERNAGTRSANDLESRMKGLGAIQISLNNDKLSAVDMSFATSTLNQTEVNNILGKIVGKVTINTVKGNVQPMRCNPQPMGQDRTQRPTPTRSPNTSPGEIRPQGINSTSHTPLGDVQADLVARIEVGARVSSIAQLCNRIYALCHSKIIHVFDARSFARLKHISIDTSQTWIGWLIDKVAFHGQIAACSIYDCVYVSDYLGKCIWQLTDEGRKVVKWLHTDGYLIDAYYRMSVTSDGRVVVTGNLPPRIDVYGPTGRLALTVPLPSEMAGNGAIETSAGNFIVSHEVSRHCKWARVCEYTPDGQQLHSFGGLPEDGGFISPVVIAMDADGHIVVADHAKNRVFILDSTLNNCQLLIDVSQLHPKYLHVNMLCAWYDVETRGLIVAPKSEQLDIYRI